MSWITADDLETKLIAALQKVGIEDASPWKDIIPDAIAAGKADIVQAFAMRGYTVTQINGWDYGAVYHADQSLFWALTKGGTTQNYPDGFIDKLDRREELKTLPMIIAGAVKAPPSPLSVGRIGAGDLKTPLLPVNRPFVEPETW